MIGSIEAGIVLAGAQISRSRRSSIADERKSPIDETVARELRSKSRRRLPSIVPPRRARMVPVRALSRWLKRIPPDLVSGPRTCPLYALKKARQRRVLWTSRCLAGGVHSKSKRLFCWIVRGKEKDARSGGYARRGGLTFQVVIAFWVGISGSPGHIPDFPANGQRDSLIHVLFK